MRILVTGGTGMVGSAFRNILTSHDLVFVGTKDFNLTDPNETESMFTDTTPDAVIHLAARVGGVKGNIDFVADYFEDNILINTNVLKSARRHNIKNVLSLLSTCIYPDKVKHPLTPDQIHHGPPHKSNFGYA